MQKQHICRKLCKNSKQTQTETEKTADRKIKTEIETDTVKLEIKQQIETYAKHKQQTKNRKEQKQTQKNQKTACRKQNIHRNRKQNSNITMQTELKRKKHQTKTLSSPREILSGTLVTMFGSFASATSWKNSTDLIPSSGLS